ncbi:MAG: vitamin B12 dependent methionine synthase [Thomasclavelia sp.]|nr:vitamin B12 dependent methionine synthase [Thomasclavelia sp.]
MLEKNIQRLKDNALKYLGYNGQLIDDLTLKYLDKGISEIEEIASFKSIYNKYALNDLKINNISLDYPDFRELFKKCNEIMVVGYTLGIDVDRYLKKLSISNMTYMIVFDAIASSYLELKADEYEDSLNLGKRTFRFCPGYGKVPIELNQDLVKLLDTSKHIGLTIQDSNIFLPQKSMIGLIGLGDNSVKKSCTNCQNYHDCRFRKAGKTCY